MKKNNLKTYCIAALAIFAIVACNKISNELKPIEAKPASFLIEGKFDKQLIASVLATAYLPFTEDTSRLKFRWLFSNECDTSKTKVFLLCQDKSGLNIDSVVCLEIKPDTVKNGFIKKGLNKLLFTSDSKQLYLTKLPENFSNQFQFSGYYANGSYKAYTGIDTIVGHCKAVIAADGNFELWMNDSKNKNQKVSGTIVPNDTTCYACKLQKQGLAEKFSLILGDTSSIFFLEKDNTLKFRFYTTDANSPMDSLHITLTSKQ